jgi:hypothetical protein
MFDSLSGAIRPIGVTVLGAAAWAALGLVLSLIPSPVRFVLVWFVFTFGPGIAITGSMTRDLDRVRRVIIALGAGTAVTPVLIDCLGRLHAVPAFPYVASAMAARVLLWRGHRDDRTVRMSSGDMAACAALVALAIGLGAVAFGHRLESTPDGIIVNGEYDSADLSYYAAEASEASHTVPPMASYYSGHHLNAAYYPQLVLAMIHRFGGVPILPMYFGYAWPTFLSLSALTGFLLVRSVASRAVAVLAIALVLAGSDFSYLWGLSLDHDPPAWDYVLWPTNFLSPTMHLLQFNTWGPSMPVFFTVLYAMVRALQTQSRAWIVVSAVLLAVLFEFKPFAYVILMAALAAAALFSGRDWRARWHFAATAALTAVFTLPFLAGAALLDPGDRRTRLVIQPFALPKRMLIKLDLTEAFTNLASHLSPWPPMRTPLFLLLATILFLAIGVGMRWLGAPGVWRAIRHGGGENAAAWRLLGWGVVAGIAVPFVLATEPYVDTLQFYVTGLYLMWIFAAAALVGFARAHPRFGGMLVGLAVAVCLPSSVHYLSRRWADHERPPRITLDGSEIQIAEYLRMNSDPETTVILHDRPLSPSLMTIVSERRIVLGWDVRYSAVGGEERLRDVNAFFASSHDSPDTALDILGRYHVTHVVVRQQDRVHPAVIARLKPLKQFPDVTLYAVP